MQRYRVVSNVAAAEADRYREWLAEHAGEVVLAGRFAGAEVLERDGALIADYAAPEGTLERYTTERAPALREQAERLFPGVRRERETTRIVARLSAPFAWETLGLVDAAGAPVPCPADGPFTLHYVAPWCPDCHAAIGELAAAVRKANGRAFLVGAYADREELKRFFAESAPGVPWWTEPSERTDSSRMRSFHAVLRQLGADPRKWGVPFTQHLTIERGRFVARWE